MEYVYITIELYNKYKRNSFLLYIYIYDITVITKRNNKYFYKDNSEVSSEHSQS